MLEISGEDIEILMDLNQPIFVEMGLAAFCAGCLIIPMDRFGCVYSSHLLEFDVIFRSLPGQY